MVVACGVCGSAESKLLFMKDGYPLHRCTLCSHVFVGSAVTEAEVRALYDEAFFSSGSYADYEADKLVMQRNFRQFIDLLRPHSSSGKMLEIGCAYGYFLELAREHWEVEGIDISEQAVAYAKEKLLLSVQCADVRQFPFLASSYDIIVMWDTIEHLNDPAPYVRRAWELLKPGGILAVTTGDSGSFVARIQGKNWRLYEPPFHLHYFSRRTLTDLFGRCGFEVAGCRSVGYHRSLDMILERLFYHQKPPAMQSVYRAAKWLKIAGRSSVYLNLYDIILMIGRKFEPALHADDRRKPSISGVAADPLGARQEPGA